MKKILIILLIGLIGLMTACSTNDQQVDLSTWNEEDVYRYLEEVRHHIWDIPVETTSIDSVIEQYEQFFHTELSKTIVESNFIKTENGWYIPDGDAGYIFHVPNRDSEQSVVTIDFSNDEIKVKEVYEFGMFKEIEYTVALINGKPKITEWKRVFD